MRRWSTSMVGAALVGVVLCARALAQGAPAAGADAVGDKAAGDDRYLYLREEPVSSLPYKGRHEKAAKPKADRSFTLTFTPRIGVADPLGRSLSLSGTLTPLSSFTPRYRESEVTIHIAPPQGRPEKAIGIALSSEYLVQDGSVFGFTHAGSPIDSRAYQLGIALRMSGFSLGATVQRQEGGLFGERSQGIDLGFGYRFGAFETQLAVGEFTRTNRGADALVDRNFYRLELGAAYRISERVRLSGGIRLFDYANGNPGTADLANRAGMLYLGTKLSF